MSPGRILLAAGLFAAALALTRGGSLDVGSRKEDVTAAAAQFQLRAKSRSLAQDNEVTVCYEGCLVPPVDDPTAAPLPTLLLHGDAPMPLLDCYEAAAQAGVSFFAISNITSCYGGNDPVLGWALDTSCPKDCFPGGADPYICGDVNKASVFSMGPCARLAVPCASPPLVVGSSPASPYIPLWPTSSSPPSPTRRPPKFPSDIPNGPEPPTEADEPPSPPPDSPSGAAPTFACRNNTSLWGVEMAKIKLSSKNPSDLNVEACRRYCIEEPRCEGFYYKTTHYCYLMSEVSGYKQYGTSVKACRVI